MNCTKIISLMMTQVHELIGNIEINLEEEFTNSVKQAFSKDICFS